MNLFLSFLLFFFLTIRSIGTVHPNRNGSFLNLVTPELNSPEPELDNPQDTGNENEKRKGKAGVLDSIQNLFRTEDKTGSKTHNNALAFDFVGFKNVRGKKEVENAHLQVQRSSSLFTNNTEKGVLHFKTSSNKLKNGGSVVKATFKLTKMFDAKDMGFKCPSNAVKLYLINELGPDMKMNVVKGPVKLEFKKNELEVDVTNFFEDLGDHSGPTGPSMLQFTDLTPGNSDDDLVFDDDSSTKKENNNDEDEVFGNEDEDNQARNEPKPSNEPDEDVNTYLMLEADPNCYFAFDVEENKPKVRVEMSKKTTFTIKGTVKKGVVGVGVGVLVGVLGVGIYLFKKGKATDYTYFYDHQPNEIMAGV